MIMKLVLINNIMFKEEKDLTKREQEIIITMENIILIQYQQQYMNSQINLNYYHNLINNKKENKKAMIGAQMELKKQKHHQIIKMVSVKNELS